MDKRVCEAVVVNSSISPGQVSLRSANDVRRSIRTDLTFADFLLGEDVVIISKERYEFLKDIEEEWENREKSRKKALDMI